MIIEINRVFWNIFLPKSGSDIVVKVNRVADT